MCSSPPTPLKLASPPTLPTSTKPCTSRNSQSPPTLPICAWEALFTSTSPPTLPIATSLRVLASTLQSPPTLPQLRSSVISLTSRSPPTVPITAGFAFTRLTSPPTVPHSTNTTT